jgi:PAS domain S-box-containing protein
MVTMHESPAPGTALRRNTGEIRAVQAVAFTLLLIIAVCGIVAVRAEPRDAIPFALIFIVAAGSVWYVARVAGRWIRRLQLSEARLLAAAEALPDGLVILDRDDHIAYFNARYPDHLVEPLRDGLALGRPFEDWLREGICHGPIYHEEMGAAFLENRLALRQRGKNEHVHRIADGRWLRIRENCTPDGGRVILTTDITEERSRAAQLRLLALAVEQAADPVEITSASHGFTYVNHAFETTTGYAPEEVLGREPQHVLASGAQPPEFFDAMRRDLEAGRPWQGTIVNRHRDGHLIEQETTIAPLRDDAGVITHYVAVKRDVTEARAAARALAASEARYRAVVDTQTEILARVDPSGNWTFMNDAAERYIGTTLAEMRRQGIRDVDLVLPEDQPAFRAHMQRITVDQPTQTIELRARHPDDSIHWEHWTDTGIFDSEGRLIEVQCVGREITDRKLAEAARTEVERALAEREAQFRTLAESVPVGLVISEIESAHTLYLNPRARAIFGIPHGTEVDNLLDVWADLGQREQLRARMLLDGSARAMDVDLLMRNGRRIKAVMSATRIVWAGRDAMLVATVDITDLRDTEAALRASEARLNAINAANPVPMNIARLSDRKLLFVNEPYRRLYGLEGTDLTGFDRSVLYPDPATRDWLYAELAAGREVTDFEVTLCRVDGREVPVSLTSRPIVFEGEPAIVTTSVDLSALRTAQTEVARSREALHQSEKLTALGALLAGVAHELNNPLSVVVGYCSMLREMEVEDGTRVRIEKIHAAAERCARIVRTFLAMARSRPPRREAVALGEVVLGALDLAAYGLSSADVAVNVEIAPDLAPVHADADQLHQVVVNLVVNAQQALIGAQAPRQLHLHAWEEGGEVVLEVADNGPGMTPNVAKRVFEPFFTTKPQGVGTGVGLSVCHGILEAHGGRIELDTAPGSGARFRLRLPRSTEGAVLRPADAASEPGRGRVLVVDDEPEIAALLAERLTRDGLSVATATSGRRALAAIEQGGIDLVVSDLRMPDMDGTALAREIHRRWPAMAGRILMITGDALGSDLGARAGGIGLPVFEKPLDLGALASEVHRRISGIAAE